jgi:hypothetical protein
VQRARSAGFGGRTLNGTGVVHAGLRVGAAPGMLGVSPGRSHRALQGFGGRTLNGTGVVHVGLRVGAAPGILGVSPVRSHRVQGYRRIIY